MTDGLFPEPERTAVPTPGADDLSADQRRTARRRDLLARGIHPLAGTPLHPDAPRVTERGQPGEGPRCGGCRFLRKRGDWWKCRLIPETNGAGTDARRWWPACTKWEPRDRDDLRVRVDLPGLRREWDRGRLGQAGGEAHQDDAARHEVVDAPNQEEGPA